jgi:serine/threonine-protein kinase
MVSAVAILIAAISGFGWWRASQPVEQPLVRLDVDLGADVSLSSVPGSSGVILSADGTRLAYASGTPPKVFTRKFDQERPTELTVTDRLSAPFFSPDGRWIGFFADGSLKKISVDGGAVVKLADLPGVGYTGASWGDGGAIIVGQVSSGLARVPEEGGTLTPVTQPKPTIVNYAPQVLPGSKAVLYTSREVTAPPESASLEVVTLEGRKSKTVVRGATSGRYVGSGHLLYMSKGTLFALPFDLDKLEPRGNAVPIRTDVTYVAESGTAHFDVSPAGHGTLVYRQGGAFVGGVLGRAVPRSSIDYLDVTGNRETLIAEQGLYTEPRLSPDGKRLLVIAGNERGNADVFVYDLQRDNLKTRLTTDGGHGVAVWGPSSQYVIFDSTNGFSWVRADGSSPSPQPLMIGDTNRVVPWSFTGKANRLAYFSTASFQPWTVLVEERDGQLKAGKSEQFLDKVAAVSPTLSPDGQWLAYQSCPQCVRSGGSGGAEVIVPPFPPSGSGRGGQVQISNNGGSTPHWSQNNEVFYRSGDQVMVMSYTVRNGEFIPGKTRVFAANFPARGNIDWDVTPDGKRLVVITPVRTNQASSAPEQPVHTVVLLQNFFDELRRRAPVR